MVLPVQTTSLRLLKSQAFLTTALVLCAAALFQVSNADLTRPQSSTPRLSSVKPRLAFSPSLIESCVTPVVTLECSTRGGNTLEARIAARSDGNEESKKMEDSDSVKISSIKILKLDNMKGAGEDGWTVFAELGDSDAPSGVALDDPEVKVTGKVGGSAESSYLRVVWDTANDNTFGVYRCDVGLMTSQPGSGSDVVSTELLSLDPAQSDGGGESQLTNAIREMRAQRQEEVEWRQSVDERLEKISLSLELLERFARGNSYKLNRVIFKVDRFTATTTTTAPTTTPTTARTFAPPTGGRYATKHFVELGIAGAKPTATLPAPEPTEAGKGEKTRGNKRKKEKSRGRKRGGRVG